MKGGISQGEIRALIVALEARSALPLVSAPVAAPAADPPAVPPPPPPPQGFIETKKNPEGGRRYS